ncbi:multiple inositol polyphosphate phosphatase 1-like [Bradysia coprophila]|uniref:multiple inositol polyphosphate phosphatase 1-like n=1 Tax=Bradysia coprophila TaxID=38358 RepID=UPI00187D8E12|nr:multiple inositol polyphosphate phosphatase 1-like [Bradysia coprophila]
MHNPFYCYSEDTIRPQITMFDAETPYELVRGRNIDGNASNCIPSKFWLIGRTGQDLPRDYEISSIFRNGETLQRNILNNYDAGRTTLCAADIAMIRDWKFDPNITYENAELLTESGWNDIKAIAQRYQSALPTILSSTYLPTDYLFRSISTQAEKASLAAFADGLFGLGGHKQVEFEIIDDPDLLLLPRSQCPLFNELITNELEVNAFVEGPEYEEMITQVSSKLGFRASSPLTHDELNTLLLLCRFEQALAMNSTAPFCSSFSVANIQVHEYRRDIFFIHRYGYGQSNYRRLYENMPCHIMQDMMNFLRSNDPNDRRVRIFYSDLNLMQLIFVALNAHEDQVPLNRHNFAQQVFRQWKTSYISPKGANVAVIRYDCANGDHDILFMQNEKPLQLPGCQSNGLCKFSMILNRLSHYLDINCSEIFCTNN